MHYASSYILLQRDVTSIPFLFHLIYTELISNDNICTRFYSTLSLQCDQLLARWNWMRFCTVVPA